MAKVPGRLQTAAIDTGGGFVEILGIIDGSLNIEQAELNSTSHDDGQWEAFLRGRKNATIDISPRRNTSSSPTAALKP